LLHYFVPTSELANVLMVEVELKVGREKRPTALLYKRFGLHLIPFPLYVCVCEWQFGQRNRRLPSLLSQQSPLMWSSSNVNV